jgi:hypothetical protein
MYEFIHANQDEYRVRTMCRILGVAPSGYYKWLSYPISNRAQEDARLLRLIRASFTASQGIYGAPRVFLDLREAGETCSKHRVARLMRVNQLRALHGYRTRRWSVGKPAVPIPNLLQRQFTVTRRNKAWVTDITYIRTWQGWLYLAVVMDLFSRKIVGWSAGATIHRELVLVSDAQAIQLEHVVGRAHQRPFGFHLLDTTQQELSKAAGMFDLSDHRFDDRFARRVTEMFAGAFKRLRFFVLDPHDSVLSELSRNLELGLEDVKHLAKVRDFDLTARGALQEELRP